MDTREMDQILAGQRRYFLSGATLPVDFRVAMLKKLRDAVRAREADIAAALAADLGKSGYEGFMCETGLVLSELSHLIRHTPRYARPRRVPRPRGPAGRTGRPRPRGTPGTRRSPGRTG